MSPTREVDKGIPKEIFVESLNLNPDITLKSKECRYHTVSYNELL